MRQGPLFLLYACLVTMWFWGCRPIATDITPTASACSYRGELPDPVCTPGAADPAVTQGNILQTICQAGYTSRVRPPVEYTNQLKLQQLRKYGQIDTSGNILAPSGYEEDHLISLELGGDPRDPRNLWPEPGASPNKKDGVEDRLHTLVCRRQVTLAEAQRRISTDWTTALSGL